MFITNGKVPLFAKYSNKKKRSRKAGKIGGNIAPIGN